MEKNIQEALSPTCVFISHSSRQKDQARKLARRLEGLGFQVWFDEEVIPAGTDFPKQLETALDNSSHFLAIVTSDWIAGHWTQEELGYFLRKPQKPASVIALLVEQLERSLLPSQLRALSIIASASQDLDQEEEDWVIYCAITAVDPGPRENWSRRAIGVHDAKGRVPDFSRSDFLAASRKVLNSRPADERLARNVALYAEVNGIDAKWVDDAVGTAAMTRIYLSLLRDGSAAHKAIALKRLSNTADAQHIDLKCPELVEAISQAATQHEARAAFALLAGRPDSDPYIFDLIASLDPSSQSSLTMYDRCWNELTQEVVQVVIERELIEPLKLFVGVKPLVILESPIWATYFAALSEQVDCGNLDWWVVAGHILEIVASWPAYVEPMLGLCDFFATSNPEWYLDGVAQMALDSLKRRRGDSWDNNRVLLARHLLERSTPVVFRMLSLSLEDFSSWSNALVASQLTGLAAQTTDQLVELLNRFQKTGDLKLRGLLVEAALESPAEVSGVPDRLIPSEDPARQNRVAGLLQIHDAERLNNFLGILEKKTWARDAREFLAREPEFARIYWPYALARELVGAERSSEELWQTIGKCFRLEAEALAIESIPFVDRESRSTFEAIDAEEPLEVFLPKFDEVVGIVQQFGLDAIRCAETFGGNIRWLNSRLLEAGPESVQGRMKLLRHQAEAWISEFPDSGRPFATESTPSYAFRIIEHPVFNSIKMLVEHESVCSQLDTLLENGVEPLLNAIAALVQADAERAIKLRLSLAERIAMLAIAVASKTPVDESESALWQFLVRKNRIELADATDASRTLTICQALAFCYRRSPEALVESTERFKLSPHVKLQLILALNRLDPELDGRFLFDVIENLNAQELVEDELILALKSVQKANENQMVVLRKLMRHEHFAVRAEATATLARFAKTSADILQVLEFVYDNPDQRARISAELLSSNTSKW